MITDSKACAHAANSPHMDITPNTVHVVHSGKYLMKTRAINAATKIKYICCKRNGAFQWMAIIPTTPKFHKITDNVK